MLVLSRKEGEKIIIGDNIEVEIVAIQGNHVRLGISAPRDIPVHRSETSDRIRQMLERTQEQNRVENEVAPS